MAFALPMLSPTPELGGPSPLIVKCLITGVSAVQERAKMTQQETSEFVTDLRGAFSAVEVR